MSRGRGGVQASCLRAIQQREDAGALWPTTYTIACDVYRIEPNDDGNRLCLDAQHVAVKRALAGLQRRGLIVGFRDTGLARGANNSNTKSDHVLPIESGVSLSTIRREISPDDDGDVEQCHIWITEAGLTRWLAQQQADAARSRNPAYAADVTARTAVVAKRAKAMGMSLPEDWREIA